MRCSSKRLVRKITNVLMSTCLVLSLCSCGNTVYELPYDADSAVSGFNVVSSGKADTAGLFARNLCISTGDILDSAMANTEDTGAAMLFDVTNAEVLYSSNAHVKRSPASLTKILMALVALKNGTPDMILTATNSTLVNEAGAQRCGIEPGDTMTLNQALYIALLNSANDAALLIAENVGGSVDNFVKMMNDEAKALGATNSSFVNPHGLTAENQYTTAYDMYLIFNEAIQYEKFVEIIQTTSYETTYYDRNGDEKKVSVRNTNRYVNGDAKAPENVIVIGGKTGTTNAAGHCLTVFAKDKNGAPYIAIILKAGTRDNLYVQMTDLLEEIAK